MRHYILAFVFAAATPSLADDVPLESPCPTVVLDVSQSEGNVDLSDTEKKLVCGNPSDPTWRYVPPKQAAFHLRAFLQDRGYLRPEIRTERERIFVNVGPPARAKVFETPGAPAAIRTDRMGGIVGERLTPKLLDAVEKRLVERLHGAGYACPKVVVRADPNTEVVRAEIRPGPMQTFGRIDRKGVSGIEPEALSRFDAFHLGDRYDGDALERTTRRLITAEVVRSAYFLTECDGTKATVHEHAFLDAPRIVSFSVGANTERLGNLRASWRHTALGDLASNIGFEAVATGVDQQLNARGEWYPFRDDPRGFFAWTATARRDSQKFREWYTLEAGFGPAHSWDFTGGRLEAQLSPLLRSIHNVRGAAVGSSQLFVLEGRLRFTSADFEYYAASPRSGFRTQLAVAQSLKNALSPATFTAIRWNGEKLWNLGDWDPPQWILGFRWAASTTVTPEDLRANVPALQPYRYFLGGRDNLRGFGFNALPGDEFGGFTALTASVELRVPPFLPGKLEPFVFVDAGALGSKAFTLEDPVYLSPGFGLRWESPIGPIRGTFGHGVLLSRGARMVEPGPRFYLSIGEEF